MSSQVLNNSKDGDLISPLDNLCQILTTFPLKQVSPYFYVELCPSSCHWALLSRVWLCCLYSLPHQVFMHMDKIPLSFPQDELPRLSASSHMLWSLNHLNHSMCVPVSHAGESSTGHSSPGKATSATSRGEASPPSACWQCLLTPSRSPEKTFLNRQSLLFLSSYFVQWF